MGAWTSNVCPCFLYKVETAFHDLQCNHLDILNTFAYYIQDIIDIYNVLMMTPFS